MDNPTIVGAVVYHPRVVPIWEGMHAYFRANGPPIDYVLFSNYDQMGRALLAHQIDIAWNTNLAWVKLHRRTAGRCRALAMRDVDVHFTTVIVARANSGIDTLGDLRGKRLALGSADSVQAAILPLHYLRSRPGSREGLPPASFRPRRRQTRRHRNQRAGGPGGCARKSRGRWGARGVELGAPGSRRGR